jgi:6-phosphofructokinase 1
MKLKEENSESEYVSCLKLSTKTLLSLTHVLALSQLLKKLRDSSKWHMFHQNHTKIQSVSFLLHSALVKVPGSESGFLASDAVRAARNVNICLVPEFPYCFYGSGGLLRYISDRIKYRGSCVIVYAEGACKSAADVSQDHKHSGKFDMFLKQEIQNYLNEQGLQSTVLFTDTDNSVRSIPANSLDTKLCR